MVGEEMDCSRLVTLPFYLEILVLRFRCARPVGLDRRYLCERWPGLEEGKEALKTPLWSLGH